ncbi:hypothetical protein [Streptomyces fulvorobeus]|uniref:Uncharacterized protein n=1 Tax=Streptomyces fulvorobeus TaxID=284028 RepID=A0A7J0CG91_9ACTN|nr:hypothetical protein [Streptomyces fulvorobeus]NYE44222.1 hypothetical protein [Streptomyces fulvorobeus]GFN00737.1 hypothetical protein Sfulv_55470 [Streptomyces fulvorobeus]
MTARDELLQEVIFGLESGDFVYGGDVEVDANELVDAFAHELSEQIRAWECGAQTLLPLERGAAKGAANLIDPEATS